MKNVNIDTVDLSFLKYVVPVVGLLLISATAACFFKYRKEAQNADEKQEPTDVPAQSSQNEEIWTDSKKHQKKQNVQKPGTIVIAEVDEAQESDHNYQDAHEMANNVKIDFSEK